MTHLESIGRNESTTYPDPLCGDSVDDERIMVSRRGLVRLALVASETGARFARDGIAHDPMAWMLSPRRLFKGRTALDACLELLPCSRAILLHGLAIGLDADRRTIDELLGDDADEAAHRETAMPAERRNASRECCAA